MTALAAELAILPNAISSVESAYYWTARALIAHKLGRAYSDTFARRIADHAAFVAVSDERLAGVCVIGQNPTQPHSGILRIEMLVAQHQPLFTEAYIGEQLLRAATATAQQEGYSGLETYALRDEVDLYLEAGFQPTDAGVAAQSFGNVRLDLHPAGSGE